jgi:uncharacterized protein YdeI (YjbR/CyaY-like superfamily)
MSKPELPTLAFSCVRDLEEHMLRGPSDPDGFWLKLSKAGATVPTVGKQEAIEAALCCGWIDGQLGKLDEKHYLVRMTPRRAGSLWSARNKATAERLIDEGRMRPEGLLQIDAAKSDGRWASAYASQRHAEAPDDLLKALSMNADADRFYHTLDRANRYAITYRIMIAKKPETRAKLIDRFVEMLARKETPHPKTVTSNSGGELW